MSRLPIDVVLVDDAADVRGVVGTELRLSGSFTVVGEASNGLQAIDLAGRLKPAIMVLDASMPDMDGLEALPAILEESPSTRVVMLSGFTSTALEQAALALGAADFVDKGAPIRDLPGRLLRVVGDESAPAPPPPPAAVEADGDEAEIVMARHLERFRTVFDQAAIGMATMTLTGTVVRANAALCRMLGADEASIVGHRYTDLVAPADGDEVARAIGEVARGHREASNLEHGTARDPAQRWSSTFAAVRDEQECSLYLFAQADDVTEDRRAALALRESDQRFRLLVEGVRDYAIFMLDPGGHISSWNLGAERMKGYRADEIIGQHFRVFYPEEAQRSRHPEHELEIAVRDGRYEEEGWRVRKDGTRFWANVVITALFGEDGRHVGFGKVTRDVTERREATLRLEHAARETSQFVALIAHELRSPIAAVNGAADILARHWERLDGPERLSAIANIVHAGERLGRLVDDLLVAARLEAGSFEFKLEDVPLDGAIAEVIAELPEQERTGIVAPEPSGLRARMDRARFGQILTNLLSNALRHGAPPVRLEMRQVGGLVEVRVLDAGAGVATELIPRLFEKFSQGQGTSASLGAGLGLFIVRELARGQGGDAWYEADHGGRGCFAFSLLASAPS